jgi:hypothetical protein
MLLRSMMRGHTHPTPHPTPEERQTAIITQLTAYHFACATSITETTDEIFIFIDIYISVRAALNYCQLYERPEKTGA